ncbi:MAG: alpha/beta hydrolase [Pseudomonadota bacterium]
MAGPTSRHFLSSGRQLHAVVWGDEAAPPVILVHGMKDMARAWDGVAARLAADCFVVAPDLAGHGDSPWSADHSYAMSTFVYDLASLVRDIQERGHSSSVAIVGHSLGGNIALRYAAAEPERVSHLCAIEGIGATPEKAAESDAIPVGERMRAWMDTRRKLFERPPRAITDVGVAAMLLKRANPTITEAWADHLAMHATRRADDGTFVWKHDPLLAAMAPEDFEMPRKLAMMRAITAPTLLVYGEKSWAVSPADDGRMAFFNDAELLTVPDAGHWPHHNAPDVFADSIRALLRRSATS